MKSPNVELTLGDDALHTHHAAQQAGREGAGAHMFGAEAALQADKELLVLFGVCGVHRGHQVLQSTLKGQQLLKCIVHQPEDGMDQYYTRRFCISC